MAVIIKTMDHPAVDLTLELAEVSAVIKVSSALSTFSLPLKAFLAVSSRGEGINFQYPNYRYLLLIFFLKIFDINYTVSLWGSDYLKALGWRRRVLAYICRGATAISIATEEAAINLSKEFSISLDKFEIITFVIPNLDDLAKKEKEVGADSFGKLKVLCGTNGAENQQLERIIKALRLLEYELKNSLVVVFHMAYGATPYTNEVVESFKCDSGYEVIIERCFFRGEDLIDFRRGVDILIQVQRTDQLSAAMLEHLVQDKPVITGEWLDYEILDINGVCTYKVGESRLEEEIAEKLKALVQMEDINMEGNGEKVSDIFGAEGVIRKWKVFFDKVRRP